MKKCYLDSNYLVYFKNKDAKQHTVVISKLSQLIERDVQLCISPLVLDEFIHTMYFILAEKKMKDRLDVIRKMLEDVLNIPNLEMVEIPTEESAQIAVIDLMEKYKLMVRDAYHLLIIKSNSIDTLATFDKDFHKVFSSKSLLTLI